MLVVELSLKGVVECGCKTSPAHRLCADSKRHLERRMVSAIDCATGALRPRIPSSQGWPDLLAHQMRQPDPSPS